MTDSTQTQYPHVIFRGETPNRWFCRLRGHFWRFHEATVFGQETFVAECGRCAHLRAEELDMAKAFADHFADQANAESSDLGGTEDP